MRYELMRPTQLRVAIKERWPVVLPLGVLEYHGDHLPLGVDSLAVGKVLDLLEKEMDLVILPPFYYGAASYVVAPPEQNGSIHVGSDALHVFARDLFRSLLRIGFRNIHFFIHHQSENFTIGMPTDLAFKFAARQALFEFLDKERGEGWWGDARMADYYSKQSEGDDPFNWIQGHPLMLLENSAQYPFDHAGEGETSLMMALVPETVKLSECDKSQWYARTATKATREMGDRGVEMIKAGMKKALGG